jgi:hypothetical protein
VQSERIVGPRWIGAFAIGFRAAAVRELLTRAEISFAETVARPLWWCPSLSRRRARRRCGSRIPGARRGRGCRPATGCSPGSSRAATTKIAPTSRRRRSSPSTRAGLTAIARPLRRGRGGGWRPRAPVPRGSR